jgi:hypothetical protein
VVRREDLIQCICILGWAFITMQVYCFTLHSSSLYSLGKGLDGREREDT